MVKCIHCELEVFVALGPPYPHLGKDGLFAYLADGHKAEPDGKEMADLAARVREQNRKEYSKVVQDFAKKLDAALSRNPPLPEIRKVLEKGWTTETALEGFGSSQNKSQGQCYVTARTLSYIFGWELLYCGKRDYNHYWNRLPGGLEVDFTSDQMGGDGISPIPALKGCGKPRAFKPIDQCKGLNPRLKAFIKATKEELVKLRDAP